MASSKTTATEYGQCTEDAPREPGSHWITRRARCPRKATGADRLCGPHRAGLARSQKARERWDTEAKASRIEWARQCFVTQWRTEHPDEVFDAAWICPLCNKAVQSFDASTTPKLVIGVHKINHGKAWAAYEAAGQDARGTS